MSKTGLFVGMIALDLVYLATKLPTSNQKIVASEYTIAAGGPATNAAVTFNHLGNQAEIVGVVGIHPITHLIRSDLANYGVKIADLNPTQTEPPPIASIIVTQATGSRAVVSIAAPKIEDSQLLSEINFQSDIILIDGHQISAGYAIAQWAKKHHIPVVIDGGSWKPGFEKILPLVDYAICSANFYPPNCHNSTEVIAYLAALGIPHIAITQDEKPILYSSRGVCSQLAVPAIDPVDTMGAGDVFHGAFCHYILQHDFKDALTAATKIASHSCQFFGTRQWMRQG
ncbi:MAG: sugar kinase [Coleofasciculaceae cyanobacterium]